MGRLSFLHKGLPGNSLFFHYPFTEVDQFATWAAKWPVCLRRQPWHRFAAVWAVDAPVRFVGHQKMQQLSWKLILSWHCVARPVSVFGTMKRMLKRCLPPLISA